MSTVAASPQENQPQGNQTVKQQAKQKRYKFLAIILAIFAVFGVAGLIWWMLASGYEETDNATLIGHVHPISPRVGGTIERVLVDDDQYVKEGQLIATIDPSDYEVALTEAQANLEAALAQKAVAEKNIPLAERQSTSQLLQAEGGVSASSAQISQTQAAVTEASASLGESKRKAEQANANYQKALNDFQRYQGVDPDAISAQQLDAAKNALQVAEASKNAAQDGIRQAQARLQQAKANVGTSRSRLTEARGTYQNAQAQELQVDVAKSNLKNSEASIQKAQAMVERAKLDLSYTKIYAPVSGRIGRKAAETGQRVSANEPLMSVVPKDVWVVANFKETQLRNMKIGQPVEVDIDAFSNHKFEGHVASFSPATGAQFALLPPENATGNFTKIVQRIPIKILLEPKSVKGYEDHLAPGLSVVAKVNTRDDGSQNTKNTEDSRRKVSSARKNPDRRGH